MEDFKLEKNVVNKNKEHHRQYFFRQMLICSGGWTCYFILGISFGATTVFIPQIRKEAKSNDAVSESAASWIPAITIYAGLPWALILPISMKYIGRKYTFTFVAVANVISFVVFYLSTTLTHIIISEFISGINMGSHFIVSVMIITEYSSPKHRGAFLIAKSASLFWGILVSNAIGTFFHWRNIGLAGLVSSIYNLIVAVILPESPFWLATKQRFEKCSETHRWLIGDDKQSETDLENLINFQKNLKLNSKSKSFTVKDFVIKYVSVVSSKQFYKPFFLCCVIESLYVFSGKSILSVYALDIINKITAGHSISAYTAMLILDGVSVFCMYMGCFFVKLLPRRKLLIGSSLIAIGFLFSISLYSFLINLCVINESNYFAVFLLTGYSIAICCGPVIITQTITAELTSLESRGLSSCSIDLCLKMLLGTMIKITPYIFKFWGSHGAFLFFGVSSSIFLYLIYKFLPETKDKTLQEITECMKGTQKRPVVQELGNLLPVDTKISFMETK